MELLLEGTDSKARHTVDHNIKGNEVEKVQGTFV